MKSKGEIIFMTVYDVNHFEKYPDVNDYKDDLMIQNPKKWWMLNKILNKKTQSYENLTHKTVAENSVEIEDWIKETLDYPIVATPFVDIEEVEVVRTIKIKDGLFTKPREKDVFETETNRFHMWRFWFATQEDAVLFSTAWKGEES